MIKIQRCQCPSILKKPILLQSYYNHQDVTKALRNMQFGKCAYCEKLIDDGYQVDHYIPIEEYITSIDLKGKKQYNWHIANKWENLLYSCTNCNGAKKKEKPFHGKKRVIIDPTNLKTDPEKHIDFIIFDKNTINAIIAVTPRNKSQLGN
jgi:5-methylcytosine-specific restriction endonuclease McrA